MRLQQIINKAYELHCMLLEGYKTLNQDLLAKALSDEDRIACYLKYFSRCEEVKNSVKDVIALLQEVKTQSCFSFFTKTEDTVKRFLGIVYDTRNLEVQEEIRQLRDPFIKNMSLPFLLHGSSEPHFYFFDNSFLTINTRNKYFIALFQKSIEKTRDYFLENKMHAEIKALDSRTDITSDQKKEGIVKIMRETHFKHPFFLNRYRKELDKASYNNARRTFS
ncbi:MAG: hypothetical protein Q8L78_02070 [Coxiellaceae bacterium]|nr:hypothetical protein [Coxiellaceae bacterium]